MCINDIIDSIYDAASCMAKLPMAIRDTIGVTEHVTLVHLNVPGMFALSSAPINYHGPSSTKMY